MSIIRFTTRKRQPKAAKSYRKITGFLRDLTSSLDFGVKDEKAGHAVHANKKEAILRCLNYGFPVDRMTVGKHFARHFAAEKTYFFAGNSSSKSPRTLLMVDIDCHRSGSLEGAQKFAEWLKANVFANMYYETSTNGRGVHGYIIVEKDGLGADVLNGLFKRLDAYLKKLLRAQTFDVEDVEIKGTLPVIQWHPTRRREAVAVTTGQLAKYPRQADRFNELKATTVVTTNFLFKLPLVTDPAPAKTRTRASSSSFPSGSVSGHAIGDDEAEKIHGTYLELGRTLVGQDGLKLAHRVQATAEDAAVFICLLKFFTQNANADGSLPWERVRAMWTALKDARQTTRAFNPQRFAALRDLFDSYGLVVWQDKEYRLPTYADGKKINGQAAKWAGSQLFMDLLDEAKDETAGSLLADEGVSLVNEGKRESILSVNTVFPLVQKARRDIVRPVPTYGPDIRLLRHDPTTLVPHYQLAA